MSGEKHSWRMDQILVSCSLPWIQRRLVRALSCHLGETEEVGWSGQRMRRLLCFRRTLMLSSAEIDFSSRIPVTLLRYCVLLPSCLALFAVCFWIDLTPYWENDPDGMFPLFHKQVVRELASKLAVSRWFGSCHLSWHLVKGGGAFRHAGS